MNLDSVNLLILDVDGVLTDGRVHIDGRGESIKSFHAQDGSALRLWSRAGHEVAWLSGRTSASLSRRAEELSVRWLRAGVNDKLKGYLELLAESGRSDAHVAYVGDDLPDLAPMARAAFPVATANAVAEVKRQAEYITRRTGGQGAVAEVVEVLLRRQRRWTSELVGRTD